MRFPGILLFFLMITGCSKPVFKSSWLKNKAPETFQVRFETSKGNIDVEINRQQSPAGADRFYQMITHHYYDKALFYRVVPGFVVQFGNSDTISTKRWAKHLVQDEPVLITNSRGTLSYARSGKDSRNGDLFFNLKDNPRLDTLNSSGVKGFPPFGEIASGLDVMDSLYSGYANKPMRSLDSLYLDRKLFLSIYPKMDTISKVYRLKNSR